MKRSTIPAAKLEAAIREFHGNLAAAGRKVGITRTAVLYRCQRNPELQKVRDDCRESMKDHAESALHKALMGGEAWAVCFYLKCQAKDRGYVERSEHTGKDGEPMRMVIVEEVVDAADPRPAP